MWLWRRPVAYTQLVQFAFFRMSTEQFTYKKLQNALFNARGFLLNSSFFLRPLVLADSFGPAGFTSGRGFQGAARRGSTQSSARRDRLATGASNSTSNRNTPGCLCPNHGRCTAFVRVVSRSSTVPIRRGKALHKPSNSNSQIKLCSHGQRPDDGDGVAGVANPHNPMSASVLMGYGRPTKHRLRSACVPAMRPVAALAKARFPAEVAPSRTRLYRGFAFRRRSE